MFAPKLIRTLFAVSILGFIPVSLYAQEMTKKMDEVFNTTCVKTWMERSDNVTDKVAFKDFGEKYCQCASTQSLNTDDEMNKAVVICMSQTLLQSTMNTLSDEQGLKDLTADKIQAACIDKWNMVYPEMADSVKASTTAFCQCSAPKLVTVTTEQDTLTDKEYVAKINDVALACPGAINPGKGSDTTASSSAQ